MPMSIGKAILDFRIAVFFYIRFVIRGFKSEIIWDLLIVFWVLSVRSWVCAA